MFFWRPKIRQRCIKFGVLRHTTAGQLPSETRNFRQTANFRHFCFMTFLELFLRIFRVLGDFRGFCIILKFFAAEAATFFSFFKVFGRFAPVFFQGFLKITLTRRQWMLNVSSAKSKASSHCARTKFARTSDMSRVAKRSAVVR